MARKRWGHFPMLVARVSGRIDGQRFLPSAAEKMLQVPRTIRLDTGLETRPVHVVRIMGPHNRPLRLQDTPFSTTEQN